MSQPPETELPGDCLAAIGRHVDRMLGGAALPAELRREAGADFVAHLVQEAPSQMRRGLGPQDAVEAALQRFGDGTDIRRQLDELARRRARGTAASPPLGLARGRHGGRLRELATDLRYGVRSLLHAPAVSLVALATLALGVGANSAIFTILNGVLLQPLSYERPDELVRVWPEKVFSEDMLTEVGQETASYTGMSILTTTTLTFRIDAGEPRLVRGAVVTGDHFHLLGGRPLLGRTIAAADQRIGGVDAVVLSHALWQSAFEGDPGVIGTLIDLGGAGMSERRVVGVMTADFAPLAGGTQFWVPLVLDAEAPGFRGAYGHRVFARLRPGVGAAQAAAELRRLVPAFTQRHPTQFRSVRYSPVDVVPMLETMVAGIRPLLILLAGAVGFVLLIACTNVANLLLARASSRRAEIAVRVSLGAPRGRLLRQLLTESALLGLLGGALGLGLGSALLAAIAPRLPDYLPRTPEIRLDLSVVAFTAAISLLSGIVFGVAPALRATGVDPRAVLVDGGRGNTGGRRRQRLNEALVSVEIALSLVLMIGSALMLKSLVQLRAVDPGFDPESLAVMRLVLPERYTGETERQAFFEEVMGRMKASSRVDSAGGINYLPLGNGSSGIPYQVEGQSLLDNTSSLVANFRIVTPDYFATLGMQLMSGRATRNTDLADGEQVVVINEAMVRAHWPDENPLGKHILSARTGEPLFTVVGVVSDIRQLALAQKPSPEFYLPATQMGWDFSYLVARVDGDPTAVLGDLRAIVRDVDADVIIDELTTMEAVIHESMGDGRFFTGVFSAFAVLAALLGVIGVYGVVSYTTSQRTREIGLRVALGASPRQVVRAVMLRALLPVGVGVGGGLLLAVGVTRFMRALLFEVTPTDPGVYFSVAVVLAVVGLAASLPPAWRAAATDPLAALRAD